MRRHGTHAGRFSHLIPTPHSRIVVNIFINSVIQRAEGGFTRRLVWGARRQGASPHSRAHTHPIHSLSETERRAAQEVFASEGRRVMSRCRLAEDDTCFRAPTEFRPSIFGAGPDAPGRCGCGHAARYEDRSGEVRRDRFTKKKYSISCAVGVRPHAHHTLTSAQGRAARSV